MSLASFTHAATEPLLGCSHCADRQKNAALSPARTQGRIWVACAPTVEWAGQGISVCRSWEIVPKRFPSSHSQRGVRVAVGPHPHQHEVCSARFSNGVYAWRCLTVDSVCISLRRNDVGTLSYTSYHLATFLAKCLVRSYAMFSGGLSVC